MAVSTTNIVNKQKNLKGEIGTRRQRFQNQHKSTIKAVADLTWGEKGKCSLDPLGKTGRMGPVSRIIENIFRKKMLCRIQNTYFKGLFFLFY